MSKTTLFDFLRMIADKDKIKIEKCVVYLFI